MADISALLALREGITPGPIRALPLQDGEGDYIPGFQWYLHAKNYGAVGYWTGHKQSHKDERWYLTEADAKLFAASHDMLAALEAQQAQIDALRARAEAAEAKVARLLDAMKGVWQYGSDTLVGPSGGVKDDRNWQREGVVVMTSRAEAALREIGGGNG